MRHYLLLATFLLAGRIFGLNNHPSSRTFSHFGSTQTTALSNYEVTGLWARGSRVLAGAYSPQIANAVLLFLSTDAGSTWEGVDTIPVNNVSTFPFGILSPTVTIFGDSTSLFVGIGDCFTGGVYVSTDHGASWNQRDSAFIQNVNCFTSIGATIFAGTDNGVYHSTDQGTNWSPSNTGLDLDNYDSLYGHSPQIRCLASQGPYIFAGSSGEGIFRSSNNGVTWSVIDTVTYRSIYSLVCIGNVLFASPFASAGVLSYGFYASSDSGLSWIADTGFTNYPVYALLAHGVYLFVGAYNGIYFSADTGKTLRNISDGKWLDNTVNVVSICDSTLLVGTSGGVWVWPLSQLTTEVEEPTYVPSNFVLNQNYPNPFNPTTIITYQLSIGSFVKLEAFDVLGRKVKVLMNMAQTAGDHSVIFDANGLSSGVYFYRLETNTGGSSRKMVYQK